MSDFTPSQTGFSRVFIIEGRARPDHKPAYKSCMKAGGVDQAFGDVERIECPDPTRPGQFVVKGEIQGAVGQATMDLMGRFAADLESDMLRLARQRCPVDVQVHFGVCKDLSDFNSFTKSVVLELARLTNYSTDELGALSSDEAAAVNETAPISARVLYEVLPLSFAERAGDVVTNEVVDVVICDAISCGDCGDESGGCEKIYAVTLAAGGSAGTPSDLVYSLDKGATWYAHDIDSLGIAEDADAIDCLGKYLVVVSADSNSLHYVEKDDVTIYGDHTWAEVTTGFVATKTPLDIWSSGTYAFIVGNGGYIYGTADPTAGVSVLDAGVATTQILRAVHGLSDEFAVAVGSNGAIVKTENGTTWALVTPVAPFLGASDLRCVWVKSEDEWWIGTGAGALYYTLNGGVTFTAKTLPGTYTAIYDIVFSSDSVGYVTGVVAGHGRIARTFDGGYSWITLPEGVGVMPAGDKFNALGYCGDDVNMVVAVGLADNATDGFIVLGED